MTGNPNPAPAPQFSRLAVLLTIAAALLAVIALAVWTAGDDAPSAGPGSAITIGPGGGPAPLAAPAPGDLPAALASGNTAGQALASALNLQPHVVDRRLIGYVIAPGSDQAVLDTAGLRTGDLILDLDGAPLDPQRIANLPAELSQFSAIDITYERDGQARKKLIDLAR